MADIADKLADWCTDFDGSPMSPAEAPLDGLHCDDLYAAITEILALRTRADAAEKMCTELEAALAEILSIHGSTPALSRLRQIARAALSTKGEE